MSETSKGILFGVAAYGFWGMVAVYFKLLRGVAPAEILAHRIVWSVAVLIVIVTALGRWPALLALGGKAPILTLSTCLVAANWFVFIWSVAHDRLVDASLGYFIIPLVNVVLGFIFLRERLRPLEWVSVALAAAAVVWLILGAGFFPWISLALALTFGGYGLVRKIAAVPSIEGLTIETAILFPIALGYLIYRDALTFDPLLVAAGPITALPLLCFASAVRRLRLATVGLLQYISPTIQLSLAVVLYREPLGTTRLIAFVLIWCAIAIYTAANVKTRMSLSPG